ncbi:MAG: hypothetical protein P8R42_16155 [Candidatus Binatia bacterium]|nr:hypothetical protein [Candidatus Binatia bacterium]
MADALPEVEKPRVNAMASEIARDAIERETLGEAAEVDRHAGR